MDRIERTIIILLIVLISLFMVEVDNQFNTQVDITQDKRVIMSIDPTFRSEYTDWMYVTDQLGERYLAPAKIAEDLEVGDVCRFYMFRKSNFNLWVITDSYCDNEGVE